MSEFQDIAVCPSRAASILELTDVRLIKLDWEITGTLAAPPYSFSLKPHLSCGHQDSWIIFQLGHQFTATSKDSKPETILKGDVVYQATYTLPESAQIDDDDLLNFGNSTVPLVVSPFLRELLHSLTARSGLPPIVLPLLRTHVVPQELPNPVQPSRSRDGTNATKTKPVQNIKKGEPRADPTVKSTPRRSADRNVATKKPPAKQSSGTFRDSPLR